MAIMIIEKTVKTVRAVRIVSTTDSTHFKFAVYFFLDIVLNIKQSDGTVIMI